MGSTAPYITASLEVPSPEEERLARLEGKRRVDADTALRNNATVMREVAIRLAERYDCADHLSPGHAAGRTRDHLRVMLHVPSPTAAVLSRAAHAASSSLRASWR